MDWSGEAGENIATNTPPTPDRSARKDSARNRRLQEAEHTRTPTRKPRVGGAFRTFLKEISVAALERHERDHRQDQQQAQHRGSLQSSQTFGCHLLKAHFQSAALGFTPVLLSDLEYALERVTRDLPASDRSPKSEGPSRAHLIAKQNYNETKNGGARSPYIGSRA